MDITALAQMLFRVEFRRLLLIIGTLVATIIVSQCFALTFPYGKTFYFLSASKDSTTMMIANAGSSNNSKQSNKVFGVQVVANSSDALNSEGEIGYENEIVDDEDTEYELAPEVDNNSNKKFVLKKGIIDLDVRFEIESDIVRGNVSTLGNRMDEKYEKDTSFTTNPRTNSSEDRKRVGSVSGIFVEGIRNLSVGGLEKNVEQTMKTQPKEGKTELVIPNSEDSTIASTLMPKRWDKKPTTISQMNTLLLRSPLSTHSTRPRWSSVRDRELLSAKLEIENAPIIRNSPELSAFVFRNVSKFKRSYELMERMLKVYIYREGEKPVFHQPYMRGIYASEGWFMKLMEANKKFVVRDPRKAHLFYLPFSSKLLRTTFENSKGKKDFEKYLKSYVGLISRKYRFWNRTEGADHFLVACHDWASFITRTSMKNCIRALCNANVGRGFVIGKDTSLPVTYVRSSEDPLKDVGGKPASERSILAFFAGGMHGYLRPILLHYWENKESDMKIFGPMPRDIEGKRTYREYMKSSKYCICAKGYEVHTPRVVEAIFYECVPVIISDNYVPPLFEVLNWEAFSVFVQEKDIHNLRNILLSIPKEKYEGLQLGVRMVQKHFFWHKEPVKYDLFHMILHSVWNNKLLQVKT
ncbi:putative glycosyltransferase [Morus notabilis]|uniref:Putative glycosyltransferase n=2 Tax=Morus notabilis TaxID=981085 RepID=W9QZ58_9ROSA|nr:putative glycosyltransferase [Morus notabilis]